MSIKLNIYIYTYNICTCVCVCLPTEKFIDKDNKIFSTLMKIGLKSEKKKKQLGNTSIITALFVYL